MRLASAEQQSTSTEIALTDLYELLADQKSFLAALPTLKPAVGAYTSGHGVRAHPNTRRIRMHNGVDIANSPGTPILATANGIVKFAGQKMGYGLTVIIDHGYGLESWYAHTRRVLVRTKDRIRRGTKIALMGTSGHSTGSHLHYEIRIDGIPTDPLPYILEY